MHSLQGVLPAINQVPSARLHNNDMRVKAEAYVSENLLNELSSEEILEALEASDQLELWKSAIKNEKEISLREITKRIIFNYFFEKKVMEILENVD